MIYWGNALLITILKILLFISIGFVLGSFAEFVSDEKQRNSMLAIIGYYKELEERLKKELGTESYKKYADDFMNDYLTKQIQDQIKSALDSDELREHSK